MLEELRLISPRAVEGVFGTLAALDRSREPNNAHRFLSWWLREGGVVTTTNWDTLIERCAAKWSTEAGTTGVCVRYRDSDASDFEFWSDDLRQGGCLFKLHGSLEDEATCLGALEHVGTFLTGARAEVLSALVSTRPLCFVGWRGADPDIPAFLADLLLHRDPQLPTFWVHYEGARPGSVIIEDAIAGIPHQLRPYASSAPILTEADRLFSWLLSGRGIASADTTAPAARATLDFHSALETCSPSGAARFLGSALRRADEFEAASDVLRVGVEAAQSGEERAAALQELAHAHWALGTWTSQGRARRIVQAAEHDMSGDPEQEVNTCFGLVSMTVSGATMIDHGDATNADNGFGRGEAGRFSHR